MGTLKLSAHATQENTRNENQINQTKPEIMKYLCRISKTKVRGEGGDLAYPTGQIGMGADLGGHIRCGIAVQIGLHKDASRRQGGDLRQQGQSSAASITLGQSKKRRRRRRRRR